MKRIVIKVGTNLLTKEDGSLNKEFLSDFTQQVFKLHEQNHQILIVTSGAMAAGRAELKLKKEKKTIPVRQVLASVGQAILMNTYRDFFQKKKISISQILLCSSDFQRKASFLNTQHILELLFENKIIPIINENDVTSYEEIKFGDNDNLASLTAAMISADLLLLLTNVDGLFTANPQKDSNAKKIDRVDDFTPELEKYASGTLSKNSLGGMQSKLKAAKYACESGVDTIIANGRQNGVVEDLIIKQEAIGTFFSSQKSNLENRKKWMAPEIKAKSTIIVDQGAEKAIKEKGSSLLSSGIIEVEGEFSRGDIIQITSELKNKIAFGQVNYSAHELAQIKGSHSKSIQNILGYCFEDEVIHRDNMLLN